MNTQAPFIDVTSFTMGESDLVELEQGSTLPLASPFLSLYQSEEMTGMIDPESEEYVVFINELYDEEFDEALSGLIDEAAAVCKSHFLLEQEDPHTAAYQAERLLNEHFAPLMTEAEAMLDAFSREFGQRDFRILGEQEIDSIIDRYQPSAELSTGFDEFLGKIKKAVGKAAKKAVDLAKKGVSAAAKLGLGPILSKLKALVKPLLRRVIATAIGKLPAPLQPVAKKLAERVRLLKEFDEGVTPLVHPSLPGGAAEIQYEFDYRVANLIFAHTEVEQDLELAQALVEEQSPETYPVAELEHARERFIDALLGLKAGEDSTPHIENFVPLILPALKTGITLVGRKRVVNFLAKLLGKLIGKFVGPEHAPALSRAIVDTGLRLLQLEATPEDESRAAASAVAATIEDTVRRVADAPDYILDDQELLEGFVLESFEQAAAANLPPVLPEAVYRKRPDLAESGRYKGTWLMLPLRSRKRYKKFSIRPAIKLTPHRLATLETFDGIPLEEYFEAQLGLAPGEELEAIVHLYEAIPGTRPDDIVRLEQNSSGAGAAHGIGQLHPLTPEVAALLLGESGLGREVDPQLGTNPLEAAPGQRFYALEIPGKRPLAVPGPAGRVKNRRPTQFRLVLDFPRNEIRIRLFLSEIRAQEIAVKLRQHGHIGTIAAGLRRVIDRGLRSALKGAHGRLKIIHEAVTPDQWAGAFQRLPSLMPQMLLGRLTEWLLKGLANHLKQHSEDFIKAAEDTADGITLVITLGNPPGFPLLRQALKGKNVSFASLKLSDGEPTVKIRVVPGYTHD